MKLKQYISVLTAAVMILAAPALSMAGEDAAQAETAAAEEAAQAEIAEAESVPQAEIAEAEAVPQAETATADAEAEAETETETAQTEAAEAETAESEAGEDAASVEAENDDDYYRVAIDPTGVDFLIPKEMRDIKGRFSLSMAGPLTDYYTDDAAKGITAFGLEYIGLAPDLYADLVEKTDAGVEPSEEELNVYFSTFAPLFTVYGIDGGRNGEDLTAALNTLGETYDDETLSGEFETIEEIGTAGDYTFYFAQKAFDDLPSSYQENMDPDLYAEYTELYGQKDLLKKNITVFEPVFPAKAEIGDAISFEATDLEGNPVNSAELFAGSKYTMFNVWATWCHFCIEEMPDLEAMSQELKDQGVAIVGFCADATTDELIQTAKDILAENGVTYLNLAGFDNWQEVFVQIDGYPTTYFIDSEGKIAAECVVGKDLEAYRATIEQLLSAEGSAEEAAADEKAAGEESSDVETSDEEASDEEASNEEASDKEASDEEASDEETSDEGASTGDNSDDESSTDDASTDKASGEAQKKEGVTAPADASEMTYHVKVVDQNSDPVPGVTLLFCTDSTCEMATGNDDGMVEYTGAPYAYHLQILQVPEGYTADPDFELYLEEGTAEYTIEVMKD